MFFLFFIWIRVVLVLICVRLVLISVDSHSCIRIDLINFPCGLLFSRSRFLFDKERNGVNRVLATYAKSSVHPCKTNSFMTFNKLQ